MKRLVCLSLILLLFTACAKQQTMFLSQPAGARVSIDGQYVGTTPCKFDYNLSAGQARTLTLEKEGYVPLQIQVKADEANPKETKKWLAAGLLWSPLFLGTLFTKGMNDKFVMVLKRDQTSVAKK